VNFEEFVFKNDLIFSCPWVAGIVSHVDNAEKKYRNICDNRCLDSARRFGDHLPRQADEKRGGFLASGSLFFFTPAKGAWAARLRSS